MNEIKRIVNDDEMIEYIADSVIQVQGEESTMLPCLKHQLEEVEKGIDNLVNAIQMGICNDATKKRMDELEKRKTELNIQIAKEELSKPTVTREQIICWLEHFKTFDTNNFEHRKRFIDTFVNKIFLYDDRMIITFNYDKGSQTVTFDDIEKSGMTSFSNKGCSAEPKTKDHRMMVFCFCPNGREQ